MTKFEEKKKEAYEKASMKSYGNIDGSRPMRYLLNELENAGLLKEKQALPVVPECVGKILIQYKGSNQSVYGLLKALELSKGTDIYNWIFSEGNQDIFALAFITGKYEVEKPQLFYIELPNVYGLKNKVSVSKVENGTIVEFSNGKNYALKFTEQEIKSIDERYWQFAVPVEDGE